ncbi:hypothetical protein LTS18_000610 [Coniosporium uncinatum]|uniref:Uncharacterized protein n=1 Tax=Coniosporium uncinatum TaxID=93489 RepID=A0ACC3DUS8_9PEZI|nr:hypothetical protein LTS18_000610 [Coniosporium uncinatum]
MLSDPEGAYGLNGSEVAAAWRGLSLYTTAEPCPMCATAIRWAGFKECIYGTSIRELIDEGWSQVRITAEEVFRRSQDLPTETELIEEVLRNETDPLFTWQHDSEAPCPSGCAREEGTCAVV